MVCVALDGYGVSGISHIDGQSCGFNMLPCLLHVVFGIGVMFDICPCEVLGWANMYLDVGWTSLCPAICLPIVDVFGSIVGCVGSVAGLL